MLPTKSVIMTNGRSNQAIMNSQWNRNIMKNNQNVDPKTKPIEVTIQQNNMQQTIYVNPNQDYTKQNFSVVKPSIYIPQRIQLREQQGIMMKKSPHTIIGFQKKYCILENRKFSYYSIDNHDKLEGSLNFDLQVYELTQTINKNGIATEFKLKPIGGTKEFIFKGQSNEDTQEWIMAIELHLNQSLGKQNNYSFLAKIPKYWKHYQLSNQQVLDECQDGDIVLFKSNDMFSSMARTVLMCDYDHVAVCYRDQNQLWVYEAVQSGVGTFQWDQIKKSEWYKYYQKICIRKLNYPKKNDPIIKQKFLEYIDENMGNEYSLNVGKLFKFTSAIHTKKPEPQQGEIKRSFFCSELVAKGYKEMGLLDPIKSSTQYHPKDFCSENKLDLLNGATLSPEYLVVFEQ